MINGVRSNQEVEGFIIEIKITCEDAEVMINMNGSRDIELSKRKLIKETLKGLLITATEKILVLGLDGAKEELNPLRDMYIELVEFWNLGEDLLDEFDEKIGLVK